MNFAFSPLTQRPAWAALQAHHQAIALVHPPKLFAHPPGRGERLAVAAVGVCLDDSKRRINDDTVSPLVQLAEQSGLREPIDAMFSGEKVNVSERRAVLHLALRAPRGASIVVNGVHYIDVGTRGGVWGLEHRYCIMIGGEDAIVQRLDPIFARLAPGHYRCDLNLPDVAEVWRPGSVIASRFSASRFSALLADTGLTKFAGRVSDCGEGRWTIKAAIDEAAPAPVLTTALHERISSRNKLECQDELLSAMRHEFGGHLEKSVV